MKVKYGRQYQIGRLGGNFLIVDANEEARCHDAHAIKPMIKLHEELFGHYILRSFAVDRGYYSQDNEDFLIFLFDCWY